MSHTPNTNKRAAEFAQAHGKRPVYVTEEHLQFLDDLRESGDTNMYGARPYLEAEFPTLTGVEAAGILGYWMHSFGDPQR